jgi:hypothetical protein
MIRAADASQNSPVCAGITRSFWQVLGQRPLEWTEDARLSRNPPVGQASDRSEPFRINPASGVAQAMPCVWRARPAPRS